MRLSKKLLKKRFKVFNEKYFNGDLVEPEFIITGNRNTAGMFTSTVIIGEEDGEEYAKELNKIRINLSKYLIRNIRILDDILLHEMIHYYGYYMNYDIKGDHGDYFFGMADEINKDGYSIQKYYVD